MEEKCLNAFPYRRWGTIKKYKTIWEKTEDLKHTELNALSIYVDRYKNQNKRIWIKVWTNFHSLNLPEDATEYYFFYSHHCYLFFTVLFNENKYYLQLCLDNCPYKIAEKQMKDYLGANPFETDKD